MPDKPNVVLLITHDTGRFVSPYGVETVYTPSLERLATGSVLFEQAFCTAPQCSPSRAALVTGRYPHCNGVMGLTHQDYAWALHADERPAAMLFGAGGYQTWLLGLQHETHDVYTLGFDHTDFCFSVSGLPERLAAALDGRDRDRPFYCQLGCFETHRPWLTPGIEADDSRGVTVPAYLHDGPETREEMAAFQGNVRHFDAGLGAMLEVLDRDEAAGDTILVVTTDHGAALPMAKSTLRDPAIETMLFMRYPRGGWGEGRRLDDLVSNVDVLPTLLEACGLPVPDNVQGISFLPLLHGNPYQSRAAIWAEKTFHDCYDPMRAIRTEQYKYIRYFEKLTHHSVPGDIVNGGASRELGRVVRGEAEELFDLVADPHERNNLAGTVDYGEILAAMRAGLRAWMQETEDPLLDGPVASPFYAESLRALGVQAGGRT